MAKQWDEIIERIQGLQRSIRLNGSVAWFRGHRSGDWKLLSTVHRHVLRLTSETAAKDTVAGMRWLLREEYKSLYRHFKTDAWPLLEARERSDWGIIFAMQHYGVPTRLLDWTESFACALFFAQYERDPEHDAVIYVLDPQKLNSVTVKQAGLIQLEESEKGRAVLDTWMWHPGFRPPNHGLPTIAVSPIFTNPRMLAQRSGFTLTGDSFKPMEKLFEGKGIVEKIRLPSSTIPDAERFLDLAGLNAFNFFPDREGLKMNYEAQVRKTITVARAAYSRARKE